jgi:hypothetical protein
MAPTATTAAPSGGKAKFSTQQIIDLESEYSAYVPDSRVEHFANGSVTTTTLFLCTLSYPYSGRSGMQRRLHPPEQSLTDNSCIERGEGAYVWDPEGNKYLDFLAAYS